MPGINSSGSFPLLLGAYEISFNFPTNNYPIPWTGSWALADNINGYVTGKNGKQIKQATTKNSGGGFEGDIGIFPLRDPGTSDPFNPNIKVPFDIYGVHLEFTLGNYPGTYFTTGGFRVDSNPEWYYSEVGTAFGIGPEGLPKDFVDYGEARKWWTEQAHAASVPDTGSTLTLLGMALTVLGGSARALRAHVSGSA